MKPIIVKLRIAALVSFVLFFISSFVKSSNPFSLQFSQAQSVLLLITFVLFAFIIVLQIYNYSIGRTRHSEADKSSLS